ncbi:DUF4395 domain-containing protein [Thiomicrorhabdus xiamenensis]|uniref:DUF4395 domain-containing protein n=1 Tax=Thiomicrorhabdus xiamenensis TaxID=2739063 RepID=A0A7D4P4J5_9GAMM|nr:DUF4395 domain-containing protein [Thiomicrorhabdus xiamenensis]QKI88935.1 DUF4395 domain-containing protein [Thiomicrorhabdus xiamenensis]
MLSVLKNLWFRDPKESPVYINDIAIRIRAGILLFVPIYMSFTLYDAVFVSHWVVDGNTAVDSGDMDWDYNIIYSVEAIKKSYDYTVQTWVLFYALFEMLAGMFVWSARLSPAILLATLLAKNTKPVWKPIVPKRFAWGIGATFISICLVFFNPDVFANWVNTLAGSTLLPTTVNYMSPWIPLTLVWICLGFMWMETVLGFCVGCKVYSLLVKLGVFKEECEACNNIDWDEIARKNQERLAAQK